MPRERESPPAISCGSPPAFSNSLTGSERRNPNPNKTSSMDTLGPFVSELREILLTEGVTSVQQWARRALVNHGCLKPEEATASTRDADLPAIAALMFSHWDGLSAENARFFNGELKNRLHAVRHVRNRLAHYVPGKYATASVLLEDVVVVRVFLEGTGADSALVARADALIQAIVGLTARSQPSHHPGDLTAEVLRRIIEETLVTAREHGAAALATSVEVMPAATPAARRPAEKPVLRNESAGATAPMAVQTPSPTVSTSAGNTRCPVCGKPLVARTARRGPNPGGRFWGCSGYPECKQFVPDPGLNEGLASSVAEQGQPEASLVLVPRSVSAGAFSPGADCVLFEYLTVARSQLEATQDSSTSIAPAPSSQWRLEFIPSGLRSRHSQAVMRALIVAEKIVLRGRITQLSEQLEGRLTVRPAARTPESIVDPEHAFELDPRSPGERAFVRYFSGVVGPGWHRWIAPQVELSALVSHHSKGAPNGRVDFLITHPALSRPTVLEIDGPQHADAPGDAIRDDALRVAGFEVVRIQANDILAGRSDQLDEMLTAVNAARPPEALSESGAGRRVRYAGQIQAALLHAMIGGLVGLGATEAIRVSTDLVAVDILTDDEFAAVLADLTDLLQRCGQLYGVEIATAGICAASDGTVWMMFTQEATSIRAGELRISEIAFPFHLAMPMRTCAPGLPVAFDKPSLDWFVDRIYRKPTLHPEQFQAISRALRGQDAVVLLPTGAGKSIAFQLSGFLLPGRTVVVAPLISLMRDQALVLAGHGIDRVLPLSGELRARVDKDAAYRMVQSGDALFIYVAPERFQIQEFREALRGMTLSHPVSLAVIDEAHCVSEWGHDFRPAYLRIGRTARDVGTRGEWVPPLMALTGTASRMVLRDLQRELDILDYEALVAPNTFDRKELAFVILACDSDEKESQLVSALGHWLPSMFNQPPENFHGARGDNSYCGLIFCPWVNGEFGVTTVQAALANARMPTEVYAGGAPKQWSGNAQPWDAYKRKVERAFKRNDVRRIACTNAFGMGIDKPNVRYTVHYGIPASIESFYQEAGRAGRNREDAICVLLLSEFDSERNAWLLAPDNEVEQVARRLREVGPSEKDDVTRALYFETKTFKGRSAEMANARRVLSAIGRLDQRRKTEVPFGADQEAFEKVFHRLTVIGAVDDYTVNYSAKTAVLTISGSSNQDLVESYVQYVRGYQVARANAERRKATDVIDAATTHGDAVAAIVDLYLHFVYDVVERGRRRALNEMLEAARSGVTSPEAFRGRLLSYLESTQFSETLEAMLDDEYAGMSLVADVIDNVRAPHEAAALRGQVGRYLETYPDQPALLFLRGLTECLAGDCDEATARQNFVAWLKSATGTYGVRSDLIAAAAGLALVRIPKVHRGVGFWLEQQILSQWNDRDSPRQLIAAAGIERTMSAPWVLIRRVLDVTTSLLSKE